MPRKPSASRARTRRLGLLGLLLTTLLTPAGIMVGTVTAAVLIGGAFHLDRAAPAAPSTPAQSFAGQAGSPQHLSIEREGETVSLVLSEDRLAVGSGADMLDPGSPLFAGLPGSGPAPHAAPGGMPPHASPGTAGEPPLAGPNGALTGAGSSPPGAPPAGTPPAPAAPPRAGSPRAPAGGGAPAQPPSEAGAPASPPGSPQPPHGTPKKAPPDPNPGALPAPQAGEPFNPLTPLALLPPPSQKLTAQPAAVPEPSMLGLMLLGSAAMAWAGRRRPARAA
jgi:hypothetical protein